MDFATMTNEVYVHVGSPVIAVDTVWNVYRTKIPLRATMEKQLRRCLNLRCRCTIYVLLVRAVVRGMRPWNKYLDTDICGSNALSGVLDIRQVSVTRLSNVSRLGSNGTGHIVIYSYLQPHVNRVNR